MKSIDISDQTSSGMGQGLQQPCWFGIICLVALANIAIFDKMAELWLHL